jgi:hypothetical protein
MKRFLFSLLSLAVISTYLPAQPRLTADGYLELDGKKRFILGTYHNPADAEELNYLAQHGINLVHCSATAKDLDLARAAGLYGWINTGSSLDLSQDATNRHQALAKMIESFKSHPALAVWEAPDEALWNITWEAKYQQYFKKPWTDRQLDSLYAWHEKSVNVLVHGFEQGVKLTRQLDPNRPIWFNHAPRNTQAHLKKFSGMADIAGCDIYPVAVGQTGHSDLQNVTLSAVGDYTDLMQSAAPGKSVWMVLQAFSWQQLLQNKSLELNPETFPSFAQSRFMAYDAILHGAKGVLYWGSSVSPLRAPYWQAILEVTKEIAKLEPFLTSAELKHTIKVTPFAFVSSQPTPVAYTLRNHENDYLLIVLPEVNDQYVKVEGLKDLEGRTLYELGTNKMYQVKQQHIIVSYQQEPHVLCTDKKFEVHRLQDFKGWDKEKNPPLN